MAINEIKFTTIVAEILSKITLQAFIFLTTSLLPKFDWLPASENQSNFEKQNTSRKKFWYNVHFRKCFELPFSGFIEFAWGFISAITKSAQFIPALALKYHELSHCVDTDSLSLFLVVHQSSFCFLATSNYNVGQSYYEYLACV